MPDKHDERHEGEQSPKRVYSQPELTEFGAIRNVTLGVPSQSGESGLGPEHPIIGP